MGLPLRWVSSPSASSVGASLSWSPVVLGLFHVEVVSARLNPSHGTIDVTRVYVPRFFVSSQQRFGATDIKALGASQLLGLGQTVLQLLGKSVLQLYFIYKIAGESKTQREESGGLRGEGERERERKRERERTCTRESESLKVLKEMGLPPYLPPEKSVCRSSAIVRTRHGTMD